MNKQTILEHYSDEGDSAYIYNVLSGLAKDKNQKNIFIRLRDKELEHQDIFASMLKKLHVPVPSYTPSFKIRLMAFLAKHGYSKTVLKLRVSDESREVKTYLGSSNEEGGIPPVMAKDEAAHSRILSGALTGKQSEIWHRHESGGMLHNIVYGFNDGLTANFGLIMGVIGSAVDTRLILLSGIAGLIADTFSMGSSSYLAAVSEKEVYQHEISLEKEEMELMPQAEQEELTLIYQAKGMSEKTAKLISREIMASGKENALQEMVTQELGIDTEDVHPIREGLTTGIATLFGATIPLIPFFFGTSQMYIYLSFAISMISHFGVGALRSIFTGRGIVRSGIDMFLVGLGVAVIGYGIGYLIQTKF